MREVLVAVVLVSAPLVGCIGADQTPGEASTASGPAEDPADPGQGDRSPDRAGSNDSSAAPSSQNSTSETRTNGTGPSGNATEGASNETTRPPLPANVTVANATLVERTPTSVTFRWTGTAPSRPDAGPRFVARELTVPPDRWLEVNATISWEKRPGAQLGVDVTGPDHVRCFATPQLRDTGSSDGLKLCETRPRPLDGWSTWDVRVRSQPAGPSTGGTVTREPVNFTVTLTVEHVGPDGPWGDLERAPGRPGAWTPAEEAPIRPGVVTWTDSQCTLNVLFQAPDGSSVYAGSAAHCVAGQAIGSMVHVGGIPNAARLVYCAWGTEVAGGGQVPCPTWGSGDNQTHQNDLALLEVKPSLVDEVNPALPYWGGPTGMAEPVEPGDRLMLYGNSSFRDGDRDRAPDPLDPMRGVVLDQWNRTVEMESRTIFGDSGGPALDPSGRALGVASQIDTPLGGGGPYKVWYASLPWTLAFMEEQTRLEVDLLTAPLQEPLPAPTPAPGGNHD